jgi:hypothetical protein
MENEKIEYFGASGILILDWVKDEELCEQRKRHGYKQTHCHFLESYFYLAINPYIEIKQFYNEEKNTYITELWDINCSMFTFATQGDFATFCLIERYVSLAKNMVDIEKNLYSLNIESKEDN